MKYKNPYALVLGGYINGYSIIKELYEKELYNIALFSENNSLASYSNKINYFDTIDNTSDSLKKAIIKLKQKTEYIVIFPTDDVALENIHTIYDDIKEFCFIPFNYENILESLDKYVQYSFCKKYDIPYPKTQNLKTDKDILKIENMMFPVLVKPNTRMDITTNVFRSLFLEDKEQYINNKEKLNDFISQGVTFLASEFIPGNDTNIYAYVGYRSQNSEILNEWIGKKLTQYPDNFGVFSSGSNEAPELVKVQGRKLLEVMDLKGICEPEFKYDSRDGKYKLMEINLRSMMWHRVGNISGVNIQYTQYLDAIGQEVLKQNQNQKERVHLVYMYHEILNLLNRKGYWKYFKYNIFGSARKEWAVFDISDIKPFFYIIKRLFKGVIYQWLKILKIR